MDRARQAADLLLISNIAIYKNIFAQRLY